MFRRARDRRLAADSIAVGLRIGLLATVYLCPASPVAAQDVPPPPLHGRVISASSFEPVPGVTLFLRGTALQAISNSDGTFVIPSPPSGSYTLVVAGIGYQTAEELVEIPSDGSMPALQIRLERAVLRLSNLTVTAGRNTYQANETPVSVAVLDQREIEARGVVTIDEALRFAQGVAFNAGYMDVRGSTGFSKGVGSRVLMLLDGHRMLGGVTSAIDFDALPVMDLDRIEIAKGPHSTLWGGNALGGVVNILTRKPGQAPETTVRAHYGVFDTPPNRVFTDENLSRQGLAVQHKRRFGRVGTTVHASRQTSDGFRQNGTMGQWNVRVKAVSDVESPNAWEVFGNWVQREEDEFFTWLSPDRPLEVAEAELGDWYRTEDLFVGLTARPVAKPKARLEIKPQVHRSEVENFYKDNDDFHSSTRLGTDFQLSLFPSNRLGLVVGGDVAQTMIASNFLDPVPTTRDLGIYASSDITLSDRWLASVGIRLDGHSATSAESDLALNPKLGLVHAVSNKMSLRGSVTRGYRAPSVSEQFSSTRVFGFQAIPNPELRGESAWAWELGAIYQSGRGLAVDVGAFWTNYDGLIEPTNAPNALFTFQFRNVVEGMVRGVDAGVRLNLIPEKADLHATYMYLDTEDGRTGKALPYRSRHNFAASLEFLGGALAMDFRHRSRVEQVLVFPTDARSGITVFDFRWNWQVRGTLVQAKVENLFQARYVDVQERNPGASRSFRLTVTL